MNSRPALEDMAIVVQAAVDRYMEMDHVPIHQRVNIYPYRIEDYIVIFDKLLDHCEPLVAYGDKHAKYYMFAIACCKALLKLEDNWEEY